MVWAGGSEALGPAITCPDLLQESNIPILACMGRVLILALHQNGQDYFSQEANNEFCKVMLGNTHDIGLYCKGTDITQGMLLVFGLCVGPTRRLAASLEKQALQLLYNPSALVLLR